MHVVAGLWLRLSYNAGMSFSFGTATPQLVLYVTLAVALVVLVVGSRASAGAPTTGFGLVLGGALGNVIDRLAATPHTVTDFISAWRFPTFNVADAAITIGAIILTYEGIRGKRLVRR
jgi:signal peptidase II